MSSDSPVIDPQALENLRALSPDDNDEFIREIFAIFIEDTPKRIEELDQSLAAKDSSKFVRAAHSIKGSSANLGALALKIASERLENQSRKTGLEDVAALVAEVKVEFERAKAAINELIKTV